MASRRRFAEPRGKAAENQIQMACASAFGRGPTRAGGIDRAYSTTTGVPTWTRL